MSNEPDATAAAPGLEIDRFPETLAMVRFGPGTDLPGWAESSSIFSVTATATETSLVCAARNVPTKARAHRPFHAFSVRGQLSATEPGVLVGLLAPLADAGISILSISTFDTEWILVPVDRVEDAEEVWRRQGHTVAPAVPVQP
jgi:hypothetical protein